MDQYILEKELLSFPIRNADGIDYYDSLQMLERHQKLIYDMPHWIWETNEHFRVIFSNYGVNNIIGYNPSEIIGSPFVDFLFPTEFNGIDIKSLLNQFIYGQQNRTTLTHLTRHKDRSIRYLKSVILANRSEANDFIGLMGVTHDQTEQILAEKALKNSEKKFQNILSNLSEIVFTIDKSGAVTFISPTVDQVLGIPSDEIYGRSVFETLKRLRVETLPIFFKRFKQTLAARQEEFNYEIKLKVFNNERIFDILVKIEYSSSGSYEGVSGVVRDITKKRRAEADIRAAFNGAIDAIAVIVEQRDIYTYGHQHNVAELSVAIGQELNLKNDRLEGLRIAAILHDVGKVSIPTEILNRPSRLSKTERRIIEMHPKLGANILRQIPFPWNISRFVEEHHERIDGSGYPKGLKHAQISLEAKIIGVADTFDSIVNHRPYKAAQRISEAIKIIQAEQGITFDVDVVDALLVIYRNGTLNNYDVISNQRFI